MRLLLLACCLQADDKKDVEAALARLKQLKSYQVKVTVENSAGRTEIEGEFSEETLYLRSPKADLARRGDRVLLKLKDGEWRESKSPRAAKDPRESVEKLVANAPVFKKERSDKIRNVTVDVYAYSLEQDAARRAYEEAGKGLAETWHESFVDWTKAKNGVLIYVGRSDRMIHRAEQRISGGSAKPVVIDIDFAQFNMAKLTLPADVRERLK